MKSKVKIINICIFFILIIFSNLTLAFENSDLEAVYNLDKLSLRASGGYRSDKLDWNIASDLPGTATPNIASESKSDKLQIYQYQIGATIPVFTIQEKKVISYKPYYLDTVKLQQQNLYFDISAGKGNVNSGKNENSDYDGNNRTLAFSRYNSDSSGSVKDYQASLNYEVAIKYFDWISSVTPAVGYSQYEQNLRMTNGAQTISSTSTTTSRTPPNAGPLQGLSDTYNTKWKGPFIGIGLKTIYNDTHSFALTYQYHKTDFSADGNFNLRDDLKHPKSFTQKSDGSGKEINLEYGYRIFENLTFNLNLNYRIYKLEGGKIKFNNADNTSTSQKLNEVNWTSMAAMAGLIFNF